MWWREKFVVVFSEVEGGRMHVTMFPACPFTSPPPLAPRISSRGAPFIRYAGREGGRQERREWHKVSSPVRLPSPRLASPHSPRISSHGTLFTHYACTSPLQKYRYYSCLLWAIFVILYSKHECGRDVNVCVLSALVLRHPCVCTYPVCVYGQLCTCERKSGVHSFILLNQPTCMHTCVCVHVCGTVCVCTV